MKTNFRHNEKTNWIFMAWTEEEKLSVQFDCLNFSNIIITYSILLLF